MLLSACSMVYELLVAKTLSMLAANTVVWFSVTVGLYLAGMGLGAFAARPLCREPDRWGALLKIELWLTGIGAASVALLHFAHMLYGYLELHGSSWSEYVFFGTAFLIASAIGYVTGMELPLLMRLAREIRPNSDVSSSVLGLDYVGSLVGGLVFPLFLLPHYKLLAIGLLTAVVNLGVAGFILFRHTERRPRMALRLGAVGVLGVTLVTAMAHVESMQQYFLRKYYFYLQTTEDLEALFEPMPDHPEILRVSSPYQKIDLVDDQNPDFTTELIAAHSDKLESHPDFPQNQILFLNGDFQTNTTFEEVYHEYFAHVPLMTRDEVPSEILVMGGGDGFLIRELLQYDEVEHILHVDIDPVLPEFANEHPVLRAVNEGAFDDPRVESIQADGFQFMRNGTESWDAVYIDFPVAVDYDLAKLYSAEFFHFVKDRLAPGGFAVFDATGISYLTYPDDEFNQRLVRAGDSEELGDDFVHDWTVYYSTLKEAGVEFVQPYLTTLDPEQEAAYDMLLEIQPSITVSEDFKRAWDQAESEEDRRQLLRIAHRSVLHEHIVQLQQGFILFGNDELEFAWRDRGVDLHLLDERHFDLSMQIEFPMEDTWDDDYVNSIFRPAFPTVSVWQARLPY